MYSVIINIVISYFSTNKLWPAVRRATICQALGISDNWKMPFEEKY